VHRNRGIWGGKEFEGRPLAGDKACHFWDGAQCWGETALFPGKTCVYGAAHSPGYSTLNKVKLRQRCEALGLAVPEVAAAGRAQGRRGGGAAAAVSAGDAQLILDEAVREA
jgi:hypothetical protein